MADVYKIACYGSLSEEMVLRDQLNMNQFFESKQFWAANNTNIKAAQNSNISVRPLDSSRTSVLGIMQSHKGSRD